MNDDVKRQHQQPEGRLIESAMKKDRTSGRKLAEMAQLSEGRVRQIVNGYRSEGGMAIPIIGPADTVARLGAALYLTPEQFEEAGRLDVAEILRGEVSSGVTEEGDLWLFDENEHRIALADWLEAGDETVPPPRSALMLWEFDVLQEAAAKKHHDELRFLSNLNTILRSKGGDGNADANARGSAPMIQAVDDLHEDEAAYDPEKDNDKK